ncbi:hypothetical protein [Salipiger sp.]
MARTVSDLLRSFRRPAPRRSARGYALFVAGCPWTDPRSTQFRNILSCL